jgi:tRNA-2-methylthio-N6-dimethylallyladenosine synthase
VPFLRGHARSRAVDDVLEEITGLVAGGAKEVMLLGQNVNAYSSDGVSFRRLLELVNGVQGLQRIRFLTSHPASMDAGILEQMAALDKVCEFMHLPLQSGSDRILGLMNRHYTAGEYRRLIEQARRTIPNLAVSTDVIVGFPTETDEDYHSTRSLMQDVGFDTAYMFKYSPHPETASYELEPRVEEGRAQARLDETIAIQNEITRLKNQALIGRSVEVLVEGPSRDGQQAGRTRNNKSVVFDGNAEIGQLVTVAIDRLSGWTPAGRVVERVRGS